MNEAVHMKANLHYMFMKSFSDYFSLLSVFSNNTGNVRV